MRTSGLTRDLCTKLYILLTCCRAHACAVLFCIFFTWLLHATPVQLRLVLSVLCVPQVSMLVFGVLSLTIACCVAFGYKEAGEAHTARTLPSFDEALTEPENDEKVQRLSLLDRIGTSSS